MAVINLQYDLAQKILKRRSSLDSEEFIGEVYVLTSDNRLRPISRGELPPAKYADVISWQQSVAFNILEIILKRGPGGISFGKKREGEEKGEEPEREGEQPPSTPPFPPSGRPIEEEEKKEVIPTGVEVIPVAETEREEYRKQYKEEEQELREKITDYYALLGVDRTATRDEIRRAWRNLVNQYHPDKHPDASPEELARLNAAMQDLNEAWLILGDDQNRADYDKSWKQYGSEERTTASRPGQRAQPSPPSSGKPPPSPSGTTEEGGAVIVVKYQPTQTPTPRTRIERQAVDLQRMIEEAGTVEISPVDQVRYSDLLPPGFDNNQLTSATQLYIKGVSSQKLEGEMDKAVSKMPELSSQATQSAHNVPYLLAALEASDLNRSRALQSMMVPTINVQVSTRITLPPPQNQIFFKLNRDQDTFKPLTSAVKLGSQIVKKKANKIIGKAIEKGATKLAKKGAEIAVKAGVKIGVEVGVGAGAAAATGGVSLIVQAILIGLKMAYKLLKSLIPRKLKEWFKNNKKEIALSSLGLIGAGLVFANPFFIIGGLGIAAVAGSLGGFGALAGAFFIGVIGPLFVNLVGIFLVTVGVLIILTAIIYFIINTGAYIVPHNPNAINPVTGVSPYINVVKLAEGKSYLELGNGTHTVEYTITITAPQAALSDITFQSSCNVIQETEPFPDCPSPQNITVNYGPEPGSWPPEPPDLIPPSLGYQITYRQTYDSTYRNSLITDIFTVTANSTGGIRSSSVGSAAIAIGTPPSDCPFGWPVRGTAGSYRITQGPLGTFSHRGQQAIDIAPNHTPSAADLLYATHNGSVRTSVDQYGGRWVRISGNCSPYGAFSSLHGHLNLITVGSYARAGESIGIMGHTGYVYPPGIEGTHDHYEFQGNILMQTPHIPRNVRSGCSGYVDCGSIDIP